MYKHKFLELSLSCHSIIIKPNGAPFKKVIIVEGVRLMSIFMFSLCFKDSYFPLSFL